MESTRPIRALLRGLDALLVLNLRDGATVAEVASDIRLPRTTTYRVLETLAHAGYVLRDPDDDRYRLTRLVRGFSDGFDEEAWVAQIARPYLYELCRDIAWPAAIATLSGTTMLVRETTDPRAPPAVERFSAAFRVPLLTTALGLAYLSHSPQEHRNKLLDLLSRSSREEDRLARDAAEISRLIETVRTQGYANAVRARRVSDEISLALPIDLDDRVLACLAVRFSSTAVPMKVAVERFLPRLRETAVKIRSRFLEQRHVEPAAAAERS
jgi:IclR family mhp operon transcriptional activator